MGRFFNKDFYNKSLELGTSIPAVNVLESENVYHLEVALPGCKKEDFNVAMEYDILTMSSESREEEEEQTDKKMSRREFCSTSFQRGFQVPENID